MCGFKRVAKGPRSLYPPQSRQPATEAGLAADCRPPPFWTCGSAQRLAWVADTSSYMEGHRRNVLRHSEKGNISVWCNFIGACCCLHWSQPSHWEAVPDCALICSWPHMHQNKPTDEILPWLAPCSPPVAWHPPSQRCRTALSWIRKHAFCMQ